MVANATVHVVDDDAAVRDSIAFLLRSSDIHCKTYASALELLALGASIEAGCIVTDVRMPEMTGLQLVSELKRLGATHPVIVLTGHADVALAVAAMKAGVVDFLEKPFEDESLLRSVRAALAAGWDEAARRAEKVEIAGRVAQLTTREREVFEAVVAGDSNKAVALKLAISPRTVEIYRANVMSKVQAHSLSDLVRMALLLQQN